MKEFNEKEYNKRGPDGKIITENKNFYTNPYKKGLGNTTVGHLFEPVNYKSSPFNRPKELDVVERATHKSKILNLNKPFVSHSTTKKIFNCDRDVYGLDRPATAGYERTYNIRSASHSRPFTPGNPSKIGFNKTIGRFPEYIEEGEPLKQKKK